MTKLILLVCLGLSAAELPTSRKLTELEEAKFDAASAKFELAKRDVDSAQAKLYELVVAACKSVGANDVKDCEFDMQNKTVKKKEPASATKN